MPAGVWLSALFTAYAAAGLCLALAYSAARVAAGASFGFRVIVIPGLAVLWPLFLVRWLRRAGAPADPNPHSGIVHDDPANSTRA